MKPVEIRLLGPVAALRDGEELRLGGVKQRASLAVLALEAGRVVPVERLVEALWGADPPPTAATALQGHVSRLRRLLGADAIATRPPGYVLAVDPEAVDALRVEPLVRGAAGDAAERATRLGAALALWRGASLADVAAEPGLGDDARRLDELRLAAEEELIAAQIDLGRHAEVVPRLEELVAAEPLRERPVEQLMLALYRSGRTGDALTAYRAARARLREGLGLDPGASLRRLERQILEQDPALAPLRSSAPEAERRIPVTAVAVALEASAGDAEAYGRAVAEAREGIRLALERHGGQVRPGGASVVVGVFGLPLPHEDDAARALRAADEALASVVARPGVELSARAAVASGEAFAGESAAVAEAERLLLGAEARVAVDPQTHARARGRQLRLDRPLAGRAAERAALRRAFEQAIVAGAGSRLVSVVGPPGIGKSRLVGDLLRNVDPGVRVLLARCLSYGDGVAFLPAIDLVRDAAGIPPGADADAAAASLGGLLGAEERAEAAVAQLVRLLGLAEDPPDEESMWAVRLLLEAVARRAPLLVVVDDAHWAAAPTRDLLAQLLETEDVPLLVVATSREPLPSRDEVRLQPLEPADCDALVRALLDGEPVTPETGRSLFETSGGNPLFLEELVLDLRDSGRLVRADGGWSVAAGGLDVPRPLESVLAARIARLPAVTREVVGCASVIGRSLSRAALRDLAGVEIDAALEEATGEGILQSTREAREDYEFRHLLVRDAAYAALALPRRAELHGRHARWLEGSPRAPALESEALVVYHLDQAARAHETLGDDVPDAASLAARSARLAQALLARGDAAAAVPLLERARLLDASDALVAVELGRAHLDVGDFAAAEAAFVVAAEDGAGERARLGLVDVRLRIDPDADIAAAQSEIDDARVALERRGDDQGLAEALLANAYLAVVRGDAATLTHALDAALVHARRSGRSRAEAWILFLLCGACWYGPLPLDEGLARCEAILADGRGRPGVEASALQALAVLQAMNGSFARARDAVAASRAIRRDVGQTVGAAASAIDAGIVELLAGDAAAAERVLRTGADELERLGEKGYFSTAGVLLGSAVVAQGRLPEARSLARAAADAAAADDVVSQVGWRALEARSRAGEPEAERLAREAVLLADATDFVLLRAEAWSALADTLAGEAAENARATARALLERKGCAPAAVAAWTRSSVHNGG